MSKHTIFVAFFDVHFWHIKCAFYLFIRALQDTQAVDTSMHISCKGLRSLIPLYTVIALFFMFLSGTDF